MKSKAQSLKLKAQSLSRIHAVKPNFLDHRDTMDTEKTGDWRCVFLALNGDGAELMRVRVLLCVHRASVVISAFVTA